MMTADRHASAWKCYAGVQHAADMASAASAAAEEVAAEGRRRLAELAAVAVERFLALGRSLDAQVREHSLRNTSYQVAAVRLVILLCICTVCISYFAHRVSPLSKCFELKLSTAVNARSSARGARLTTASAGQRRPPTRRSCSAGRRCARWWPWSPWAARLRLRLPRGHLTVRMVRRVAAQTTRGHPHSGSRTHVRQQAGATAESLVPVRALRLRRRHLLLLLQAGEAQACRRSCARMSLPRPSTWVMRCAGCCTSCCWRRRTGRYSTASRSWRGDMRGFLVDLLLCTQGRALCTS